MYLPHSSIRVYGFFFDIDTEAAAKFHKNKCPHCGAAKTLNAASYLRKLYLPEQLNLSDEEKEKISTRFSFCCRAEGCRKRVLVPSIIFNGRSPYPKSIAILAEVVSIKSERKIAQTSKVLNVSQKTIRRWIKTWSKIQASKWFVATKFNNNTEFSLKTLWDSHCLENSEDQTCLETFFCEFKKLYFLNQSIMSFE